MKSAAGVGIANHLQLALIPVSGEFGAIDDIGEHLENHRTAVREDLDQHRRRGAAVGAFETTEQCRSVARWE